MKNLTPLRTLAPLAATLGWPTLAHAHSGHALVYDCASGLAHPLLGWDHLVAAIAVGVFAAHCGGRARWMLPAAFLTAMSCAALLGARGFVLPGREALLAMSVLVFGVLIAAARRLPLAASALVVGLFAAVHGLAHGAEIPADSAAFAYGAGFVLATAALLALGLLLGRLARRPSAVEPRAAAGAARSLA